MSIGVGIFLMVVGAILAFAVRDSGDAVNLTVGRLHPDAGRSGRHRAVLLSIKPTGAVASTPTRSTPRSRRSTASSRSTTATSRSRAQAVAPDSTSSSRAGAVGRDPDRDAPVLPVHVAGRELDLGRSSQVAACAATCSTPSPTRGSMTSRRVRSVRRPRPRAAAPAGTRTTSSRVDGPYRSSSFCPGGGVKTTSSVDLARRESSAAAGSGALNSVDRRRPRPSGDPGQPVRGRLDHQQLVARRQQRRSARPARWPACSTWSVRRVEAAYGAVVGVGDRTEPSGQHGHAERVLQQRLARPGRRRSPKSNRPCRRRCAPRRRRRSAARRSRSRPARAGRRPTARPRRLREPRLGSGPSRSPSLVVPAATSVDLA